MVKHIVLWKLKDDPDKQQNIDLMIEMLKALVGQVEGLVSIEMGYDFNPASDYDVALYATLKTPAALRHSSTISTMMKLYRLNRWQK